MGSIRLLKRMGSIYKTNTEMEEIVCVEAVNAILHFDF